MAPTPAKPTPRSPQHRIGELPIRPDGLPDGLRAGIEALSGVSMAGVSVRYDSPHPARVGALAYARGREIHLARGQEKHLPHEAWHLTQQARGKVRATGRAGGAPLNDDPALEREADRMGARALALGATGPATVTTTTTLGAAGPVQRVDSDDEDVAPVRGRGRGRGEPRGRGRRGGAAQARSRKREREEDEAPPQQVPPPVGDLYRGLSWDDAEPIDARESPYLDAIRRGSADNNPARLSLAYAVLPGERRDFATSVSLVGGNERLQSVASCHPTAEHLVKDLGSGPVSSFGSFEGGAATPMADAVDSSRPPHEVLRDTLQQIKDGTLGPQVLRYTHGGHSIGMFAHGGGLEPLESWAGGREAEDEQPDNTPVAFPLHKSVMDPKPPVPLDDAIALAPNLGHRLKAERTRALNRLSFAGIGGFEDPGQRMGDFPISLDRRGLGTPEEVQARVHAQLQNTNAVLAAPLPDDDAPPPEAKRVRRRPPEPARGGGARGRGGRGGRGRGRGSRL